MFNNKNIVLCITGGIAAYKACSLISYLTREKANVDVIMTKNACEFITTLTIETLSKNKVITDMFNRPDYIDVKHISLAKKADLFLVVPATANIIGKIANGIADDMVSTTIMATEARVLLAPAMNENMYENKIVKSNIEKLKNFGYKFIEPDSGPLACGDEGKGKLASIENIIKEIEGELL